MFEDSSVLEDIKISFPSFKLKKGHMIDMLKLLQMKLLISTIILVVPTSFSIKAGSVDADKKRYCSKLSYYM